MPKVSDSMRMRHRALVLPGEVWPNFKVESAKRISASLHRMMIAALGAKVRSFATAYGDICYLETPARPSGETVVFLHGFCDNKFSFFRSAIQLSKTYRLILPDLPGFGASFRNENATYGLDNYAHWLVDFIENLGVGQVHLAGNSLGGALALATTLLKPEVIKTLAVVDAAGVILDSVPSFYTDLSNGFNVFDIQSWAHFEAFLSRVFYRVPYMPWAIKSKLYHDFVTYGDWHNYLLAELTGGITSVEDPQLAAVSFNDRLGEVSVPTFVIWGKHDVFFPYQTAHYIHNRIPNSRLEILTDVGHSPQIEAPQKFVETFCRFLDDSVKASA